MAPHISTLLCEGCPRVFEVINGDILVTARYFGWTVDAQNLCPDCTYGRHHRMPWEVPSFPTEPAGRHSHVVYIVRQVAA